MKKIRRIVIRIIVAVAVAVILSKLKLIGIMQVNALQTYQYQANDFCVWRNGASPNGQACDTNLGTFNIYARDFKVYQYSGSGVYLPTVSFGFPSSQIQNKHVNLAFVFYVAGVETNEGAFPVRAYFVNNGDTISCNVEGSYSYDLSGKIYTVNCPHYIQYGTASRVFINGDFYIPQNSSLGTFAISNISAIYDNDELVAQQQANSYLQQILSAFQSNNQTMQDIKNNTKETNDLIKSDDTTESNSKGKDFFDNFDTGAPQGLSGIISAPLRLITSLSSSSCSPLIFPLPFVNQNVSLPCMSTIYSQFPTFYNLWQLITTGLIGYWVCINLFRVVKGLQNPDDDRIEVLDL